MEEAQHDDQTVAMTEAAIILRTGLKENGKSTLELKINYLKDDTDQTTTRASFEMTPNLPVLSPACTHSLPQINSL